MKTTVVFRQLLRAAITILRKKQGQSHKTSETTHLLSHLEHVLSDSQLLFRGAELLPQICVLLCQAAGQSRAGQLSRARQGRAVPSRADWCLYRAEH